MIDGPLFGVEPICRMLSEHGWLDLADLGDCRLGRWIPVDKATTSTLLRCSWTFGILNLRDAHLAADAERLQARLGAKGSPKRP